MSPAYTLGSFLGGFCYNTCCVQLLPLSWIRVGKKLVLAQHLLSDVDEHCKCAHGLEPWVQDVTSWSKESAGVGVIWRCS